MVHITVKMVLIISVCGVGPVLLAPSQAAQPAQLQWTKSTPLPEPRAGHAAGVLNGKLVIAGGTYWEGEKGNWTKKLFSARTHAFDPRTATWEELPDAPMPFGYAAYAVVKNRLYVLGGYDGQNESRRIFALSRQSGEYVWEVVGELPQPRVFGWAAGVGSSLYLLGGVMRFEPMDDVGTCCTSTTATNRLQVLDTDNPDKGWRELPGYPGSKRWLFAAECDGDNLWMFGGIHTANATDTPTQFSDVMRYNLSERAWYQHAPLPDRTLRATPLSPLYIDGRIVFMSFGKNVWQLDLKTQQYTELAPLPEEAFVDRYVWLDNQIIGSGGENKIESPRRRSEWTFVGRFQPSNVP